jgi:homocysteine S-methyltransferase
MSVAQRAGLLQQPLLLLDGGLGTTLEDAEGIKFSSETTPLWSSHLLISAPNQLQRVQSEFVNAGADVLLTATYQASLSGFAKTRLNSRYVSAEEARRYMLSAVAIARQAFGSNAYGLVALSLGALGAIITPSAEYSGAYGTINELDLVAFHQERLSIFLDEPEVWADIDLVAIETIPRIDEIRAVRAVMANIPVDSRRPYYISCVFPSSDDALPDGSSIPAIVSALLKGQGDPPFAVGVNCTKVYKIPRLIQQLERAIEDAGLQLPSLVLYPDGASNQMYDTSTQQWVDIDDHEAESKLWEDQMSATVTEIVSRTKWKSILVGGCCKTTPAHIAKLRQNLRRESLNAQIVSST